ncbi:hypothetical protein ACQ4M3_39655 [Leptolyngbya sp. AN03gr2]|uniref:hypothetical protein n=1 Tax=unclassified Leptolyngbya TaxID=2650499 RepID=UPI003D31BFE9
MVQHTAETLTAINFIQQYTRIAVESDYKLPANDEFSMWAGIRLLQGRLTVNPTIAHAGDLLHEAGHLVTMPLELRCLATGELGTDEDFNEAQYDQKAETFSDNPASFYRGDDDAATYWAFAACRKIGLPDQLPFEKGYPENEWMDYLFACRSGIGSSMGSRFSVQLFYAGLLKNKGDEFPFIWDILNLPIQKLQTSTVVR